MSFLHLCLGSANYLQGKDIFQQPLAELIFKKCFGGELTLPPLVGGGSFWPSQAAACKVLLPVRFCQGWPVPGWAHRVNSVKIWDSSVFNSSCGWSCPALQMLWASFRGAKIPVFPRNTQFSSLFMPVLAKMQTVKRRYGLE